MTALKTTDQNTWGELFAYFPGVPPKRGGAVNLKKPPEWRAPRLIQKGSRPVNNIMKFTADPL